MRCPLHLDQNQLGIIGAPCILHSTCAKDSNIYFLLQQKTSTMRCSRYGKREGFKTKTKVKVKQAHDASTRFQQKTLISIHENVCGYEEAGVFLPKSWYEENHVFGRPTSSNTFQVMVTSLRCWALRPDWKLATTTNRKSYRERERELNRCINSKLNVYHTHMYLYVSRL